MVFHSKSNYHYHFIISEPTKKFEEEFICLEENTEKKQNLFSSSKKRSLCFWIDKNGKEITKPMS